MIKNEDIAIYLDDKRIYFCTGFNSFLNKEGILISEIFSLKVKEIINNRPIFEVKDSEVVKEKIEAVYDKIIVEDGKNKFFFKTREI